MFFLVCDDDFVDSIGYTCDDYKINKYCTPDGTYGKGWNPSWGPFSKYANEITGHDAFWCSDCGNCTTETVPVNMTVVPGD